MTQLVYGNCNVEHHRSILLEFPVYEKMGHWTWDPINRFYTSWFLVHTLECSLYTRLKCLSLLSIRTTEITPERKIYGQTYSWLIINARTKQGLVKKANLREVTAVTGLVILLKLDSNRRLFSPCDLEIWWMTPKNNRAPLVCYFKLFASFCSHWWIQTAVTVWQHLIWVKIDDFFSCVTLKFDGRASKTIGHLFSATSSFVQHFVAIGELKLELQSGNAQSGANSMIFRAVWPWNLMDDQKKQKGTSPKHYQAICIISSSYVNSNWSYSLDTPNLVQNRRFF